MSATEDPNSDFDNAVDWLLNSRYTADPDIQDLFWGIADRYVTRDQVDDDEGEALLTAREGRRAARGY